MKTFENGHHSSYPDDHHKMESSISTQFARSYQQLQSPQHLTRRSTSNGPMEQNHYFNLSSSTNYHHPTNTLPNKHQDTYNGVHHNNRNEVNGNFLANTMYPRSTMVAYNNSDNNSHLLRTCSQSLTLPRGFKADKFEIPLPFGYHLDLDFLRFCSDELVSDETIEKLKGLRKERRKQRKTLEALMSIRLEQQDWKIRMNQVNKTPSASPKLQAPHTSTLTFQHVPTLGRVNPPDFLHHNEFLKDAVTDFEQCLEGSRKNKAPTVKSSTFPRGDQQQQSQLSSSMNDTSPGDGNMSAHTYMQQLMRQTSNSSLSSISTNSSALPYNTTMSPVLHSPCLPSTSPMGGKSDSVETDSILSITSEMSATTLRNIREQMAKSLTKLKEYEKQVEAIPVMQVKLSVLKEEKRLLMLKLKQRELQLQREQHQLGDELSAPEDLLEAEIDTDGEDDMNQKSSGVKSKWAVPGPRRRARSESPYAKLATMLDPNDFISVQKQKRSTSACGYNSTDTEKPYFETEFSFTRQMTRSNSRQLNKSARVSPTERCEISFYTNGRPLSPSTTTTTTTRQPSKPVSISNLIKKSLKDVGVNTDEILNQPVFADKSANTEPPDVINHGTNTVAPGKISKCTGTTVLMETLVTREEMEARVQEAVFRTEEEIMGCPLLKKAMAKVEEEALNGPEVLPKMTDAECQVGEENLKPFVITVGLQCKLMSESEMLQCATCVANKQIGDKSTTERFLTALGARELGIATRSIGVGEYKLIEDPPDPKRFRDIGICTEKWVEVIKASKQTDTEDFPYKDTESPRVADMVFEPSPERVVLERRSSLRKPTVAAAGSRKTSASSPLSSRKSSATETSRGTKTTGTLTDKKERVATDSKMIQSTVATKDASTSAMTLPLESCIVKGSTLKAEHPNLCDKCNMDINVIAANDPSVRSPTPKLHAPPSPDLPWLSKIPRPIPDNPDVHRLKLATSTGNLSSSLDAAASSYRPKSPVVFQRSKSNLTPSMTRKTLSPKNSPLSPPPARGNIGTPPPHPSTPPICNRRVSSPLTRSQSPYSDKKSFIPKFISGRKPSELAGIIKKDSPDPVSPCSAEMKSLMTRVVTPPALRKMYPKGGADKLATPDRKVIRKHTYTRTTTGVSNPDLDKHIPRQQCANNPSTCISSLDRLTETEEESHKTQSSKQNLSSSDSVESSDGGNMTDEDMENATQQHRRSSSGFPLPGAALFAPIDRGREKKAEPSKEMMAALKVLNDSFVKGTSTTRADTQVTNAINIVQQEWFKTSSTKQSKPLDVEDYLDTIEDVSKELLNRVVNMTDVNGNTALHYSVSHGNFDVVSVLLDSKVANPNILNKAGYTCVMLIALAQIINSTHRAVISRLFSLGDVNIRASQHGQTALMLAVSHGRLDMVQLLVEAGADINIRDEDGSTALMCSAEHGYMEIVKYLMAQPDTNITATDNDGLSALAVAMEAGHRDVGVILYAGMSLAAKSGCNDSNRSSTRLKRSTSGASETPPVRESIEMSRTPTTQSSFSRSPLGYARRNSSHR